MICLERGADCLHMVQLMPLPPKTPSSLASFESRLVLPFWYRLTQVVTEKRPLNGCSRSSRLLTLASSSGKRLCVDRRSYCQLDEVSYIVYAAEEGPDGQRRLRMLMCLEQLYLKNVNILFFVMKIVQQYI